MSFIIWLRSETKNNERRSPLSPSDARELINSGADIFVERSDSRIFSDSEYADSGCKLVDPFSWKGAPAGSFILGLKELPEGTFPLEHNHIFFAHAYKGQEGSEELLNRFKEGEGKLFDLEYLTDQHNKRIAAFGKWAGFVGTALAIDGYFYRKQDKKMPPLTYFPAKEKLIEHLEEQRKKCQCSPKVIIIGAKGRCGQGATEVLNILGLEKTLWDYEETKKGGPFKEILDHDIFINAVLINKKIPPFIDRNILHADQKLKIVGDISCDPGEMNPIPLYNRTTSWQEPLERVESEGVSIDVLAVDNLPSVLPKESSEDFSSQLLPHLKELLKAMKNNQELPLVWSNSLKVFKDFLSK